MDEKELDIQELKSLLKGKVIVDVTYGSEQANRFTATKDSPNDTGDIVIRFTDGSYAVAWNSEWGGISLGGLG